MPPPLHDVGPGKIVVRNLLVGFQTVIHQEDHVMHDGGIPQNGPVPGEGDVVAQGSQQNSEEGDAKRGNKMIGSVGDGRLHSSDSSSNET